MVPPPLILPLLYFGVFYYFCICMKNRVIMIRRRGVSEAGLRYLMGSINALGLASSILPAGLRGQIRLLLMRLRGGNTPVIDAGDSLSSGWPTPFFCDADYRVVPEREWEESGKYSDGRIHVMIHCCNSGEVLLGHRIAGFLTPDYAVHVLPEASTGTDISPNDSDYDNAERAETVIEPVMMAAEQEALMRRCHIGVCLPGGKRLPPWGVRCMANGLTLVAESAQASSRPALLPAITTYTPTDDRDRTIADAILSADTRNYSRMRLHAFHLSQLRALNATAATL